MSEETEATAIPPRSRAWAIVPVLQVLALNAVPLYGVYRAGWSWGTILALYWCESVLGGLAVALRMVVHRRLTRKRGYWRPHLGLKLTLNDVPRTFRSFVAEFLTASLGFNVAHGILLALLLGWVVDRDPGAAVHLAALKRPLELFVLVLTASLAVDLQAVRSRPFAWIRGLAEGAARRLVAIHLTLLAGFFGAQILGAPRTAFGVFAVLKLLADLAGALPGSWGAPTGGDEEEARSDEGTMPEGKPMPPVLAPAP